MRVGKYALDKIKQNKKHKWKIIDEVEFHEKVT